jgi:septal ring factor EnvC (AmiA/AmiB activator)
MPEGRPRLVAVGDPPERAGRVGSRALPPRRRLVVPLLAIALALCALGWGLARREAAALARDLEATRSALAAAEQRLAALESQRTQVRTQVQALAADAAAFAGRLGELEALVAADPEPAGDAQTTGNEAERAD